MGTDPNAAGQAFSSTRIREPRHCAATIVRDAEKAELAGRPLEWVICDTAGGAFRPLSVLAGMSDAILVPLLPSVADLATIPRLLEFTAGLDRIPPAAAILTRVPPRLGQRVAAAR